jgi:hypothetical protein
MMLIERLLITPRRSSFETDVPCRDRHATDMIAPTAAGRKGRSINTFSTE